MHKNTPRPTNKLDLITETLRTLTSDEMKPVVGGVLTLLCPSKTWSASVKRTVIY